MAFDNRQMMEVDNATAPDMDSKSATRSCTTCAKAKAKCVKNPGQDICERCARLRKECHTREPVLRKRKAVKTTSKASPPKKPVTVANHKKRAAQLEKLEHKIEHLVNALSTTQAKRGLNTDYGHPSPPISAISETSASQRHTQEAINTFCDHMTDDSPRNPSVSMPTNTPDSTSWCPNNSSVTSPVATDPQSLGVTMSEAEILLDRFRRLMAPFFPFVVIPPNITARQLLVDKPLLLHAIVTVTYVHDLPRQQTMLKSWMRNVSERTLINGEKSIDILQGILIVVAWYYPHVFSSQQTTNLLHLAQAMANDLQIDRKQLHCEGFKAAAAKAGHAPPGGPPAYKLPTNEDHRALAGTYYMSAMFATSFKRAESMRYSKYLDDALRVLEEAQEYDSDSFLIQMVRLQHLIDEATRNENPTAPMQMFVKAFSTDLETLRKADPCKDYNVLLQLQYISAEIVISEMSLNDLQDNSANPLRSHIQDLCNCVKSIKSWFDLFFTIPANLYLTLPFYFFGQFGHAFICLLRLSQLEVDGWDMRNLHEDFRFSEVLEEIARRYEDGSRFGPDGLSLNNDSFSKWAVRVRWMKQVYDSRFTEDEQTDERTEAMKGLFNNKAQSEYNPETPAQQQPTPPDDVLSGDFFNYLDENFWQSFAGDFELGFPDMQMTQNPI